MTETTLAAGFLEAARTTVGEASTILCGAFGEAVARRKADGSLVTEADHAADAAIARSIGRRFPHHAILSEEANTVYEPAADYTWVVDPLDGTTNFARGLPLWGVSMALLHRGEPIVGVLDFPMLGQTYTAIRHGGAFCNDQPIATAADTDVDDQHFIMCCTRTPRRYRVTTPLKTRILGSAAYHIATVAEGAALAGIEATPKLWDLAAALLVLLEAGGTYHLLSEPGPLFPLPPEPRDYRRKSFPIVSAASRPALHDVLSGLHPID